MCLRNSTGCNVFIVDVISPILMAMPFQDIKQLCLTSNIFAAHTCFLTSLQGGMIVKRVGHCPGFIYVSSNFSDLLITNDNSPRFNITFPSVF